VHVLPVEEVQPDQAGVQPSAPLSVRTKPTLAAGLRVHSKSTQVVV
jgi:hypothetical protein